MPSEWNSVHTYHTDLFWLFLEYNLYAKIILDLNTTLGLWNSMSIWKHCWGLVFTHTCLYYSSLIFMLLLLFYYNLLLENAFRNFQICKPCVYGWKIHVLSLSLSLSLSLKCLTYTINFFFNSKYLIIPKFVKFFGSNPALKIQINAIIPLNIRVFYWIVPQRLLYQPQS